MNCDAPRAAWFPTPKLTPAQRRDIAAAQRQLDAERKELN